MPYADFFDRDPAPDVEHEKAVGTITSLGGGHGLFSSLRAARQVAHRVNAVVTVADDGGSSGRIRKEIDTLPPGDLRMAVAALMRDDAWGELWEQALQYRFEGSGALAGHSLGNLIITGLAEMLGDPVQALDEVTKALTIQGRVLPMSPIPLDLEAEVIGIAQDPREVVPVLGQVAVASTPGQVRRVKMIPENPPATQDAIDAILNADVVTLGPGSWFSSVIPHLLVPGIVEALENTEAKKIIVLNLVNEPGETAGFSIERYIHMLTQHAPSLKADIILVDESTASTAQEREHIQRAAESLGAQVEYRDVRADDQRGRWTDQHDPEKLAKVFVEFGRKY